MIVLWCHRPAKTSSLRVLTDGAVAVVVTESEACDHRGVAIMLVKAVTRGQVGRDSRQHLRSRNSGGQVGSTTVCPPGCRPMDWEPDTSTTETNPSLSSTVSDIDYPNPYRAPLEVLLEIRGGCRTRPRAWPLGPHVPHPQYRQPPLPFPQIDRRIVDDRVCIATFRLPASTTCSRKAYAAVVSSTSISSGTY